MQLMLSGSTYENRVHEVSQIPRSLKSLARFFFFSSRRRHTRCSRDWSSDVCSSDLLEDFNAQLRAWVWGVANQRVHGTTHEQVAGRWGVEQFRLQSLAGPTAHTSPGGEAREAGGG